ETILQPDDPEIGDRWHIDQHFRDHHEKNRKDEEFGRKPEARRPELFRARGGIFSHGLGPLHSQALQRHNDAPHRGLRQILSPNQIPHKWGGWGGGRAPYPAGPAGPAGGVCRGGEKARDWPLSYVDGPEGLPYKPRQLRPIAAAAAQRRTFVKRTYQPSKLVRKRRH